LVDRRTAVGTGVFRGFQDWRAGTCACARRSWLDNRYIWLKIAVIVESLPALQCELRKAAATAVSVRCSLSKAAVDEEGSVGIVLVRIVAITNVKRVLSERNLHIRGITLASRNIVDVLEVSGVFRAKVDVVTVCICPASTATSTAIEGRATSANIF